MATPYCFGHASGLPETAWRKSSFSAYNGSCVEVADLGAGLVAVRDSKRDKGPILVFSRAEWVIFIADIKLSS
ncbi:MAG: DUF397 domain-containing protein [Streptosporangiales bacterium]